MDLKGALRELEAKGKLSARKNYAKHGVTSSCFGVPAADIAAIAKDIKRDHALAVQLWGSGNHDARMLATRVVDPAQLDDALLLDWLDDVDNDLLADAVSELIAHMPHALALARRLVDLDDEWPSTVGWSALARLITADTTPAHDALATQLLVRVERTIASSPNRTKHAMNAFVIAAGSHEPLRANALDTAKAIGVVTVNHGDSGGKTPDAAAAIAKGVAQEKSQAKKNAKSTKR